jgi:hypothetical protein
LTCTYTMQADLCWLIVLLGMLWIDKWRELCWTLWCLSHAAG